MARLRQRLDEGFSKNPRTFHARSQGRAESVKVDTLGSYQVKSTQPSYTSPEPIITKSSNIRGAVTSKSVLYLRASKEHVLQRPSPVPDASGIPCKILGRTREPGDT